MGGEAGGALLAPELVGVAVLILVAVFAKPISSGDTLLGLSARRIALGYIGALVGLAVYWILIPLMLGHVAVEVGAVIVDTR